MKMKWASVLTLFLAVLLLVPSEMLPVSAAGTVDSGTCGENLTWTLDDDGMIIVSGTGAMYDYDGDSALSPMRGNRVRNVVLEPGVTSIGNQAFYRTQELVTVSVPDGVTRIGEKAFMNSAVETVNLPEGVTEIGNLAFAHTSGLSSITIPGSVRSMDDAFAYSGLESVVFGEGIQTITGFSYCFHLKSVSIPQSAAKIAPNAFAECHNLTRITIPAGVKNIGNGAFFGIGISYDFSDNEVLEDCHVTVLSRDCVYGTDGVENGTALGSPRNVIIHCYAGSTTEAYAKKWGYTVELLPEEPEPTEPDPTEPETTEPTEPDVTEPDPTEPETTEPTEPEATEPVPTEPETTVPTEPEATEQVPTEPEVTDHTEPESTKLAGSEEPDNPKTGDERKPGMLAIFLVISALGIAVTAIAYKKKWLI